MAVVQNYLPGDSHLIDKIVCELKSQGIFDEFRKECIADVDTKPAYQNLRQRVEGSVTGFLNKQTWNPDMNKNHVRELLRKNIYESGFLEIGVERIVDQVVNPKINSFFLPKVTDVVYKFLGVEKPNSDKNKSENPKVSLDANNLLPTDLEAVSPESETLDKKHDKSNDSQNLEGSKIDEDESPPFEPIEEQSTYLPNEENSVDSNLSGFSGLLSHDSNQSQMVNHPMQFETSNQDSVTSKHSSDGHLSIVMSDDTDMKMEFCEDSHQSKSSKTNDSNSKVFDFGLDNSRKTSSSKVEKISKAEDKTKTNKRSSDKYKSRSDSKNQSKDRREEKDRKSDHDKKNYKNKHSSKNRDKSKDSKDHKSSKSTIKGDRDAKSEKEKDSKSEKEKDSKSEKEKDSKSEKERDAKMENKNDKQKSKSSSSSGSYHKSSSTKDKSSLRKDCSSKDRDHNSNNRNKTKSSREPKDSKSKDDKAKSYDRHDSKIDKNKKEDKYYKHHSKSEKQSSSSKNKEKDKKESKKEKKENEDDHFSSKKKSDRRSTDRDSNDGQSGLKSSSSSFESYMSSQTHSKSQESSNSNSNTGSGDSGASDAMETEVVNMNAPITFVTEDVESVGEVYINAEVEQLLPQIKLIKPKFASNIREARKLMKIRKQLSKIEQQNALHFANMLNNKETYFIKTEMVKNKAIHVLSPENESNHQIKCDHKPNILKKEDNKRKNNLLPNRSLTVEIPSHNSVSEEDAKQISPLLKSSVVSAASWDALEAKLNQTIDYSAYYDDPETPEKIPKPIRNINPDDCLYLNKNNLPITDRYVKIVAAVLNRLEREVTSFEDETRYNNLKDSSSEPKVHKVDRENNFQKKSFKRKLIEYSDTKNNNKKFNNHRIEEHENFLLPLSPESDISVDKRSDISESEKVFKKGDVELSVKVKKSNKSLTVKQRYSSEDLYKPRPFFSGSRRRQRNNVELD